MTSSSATTLAVRFLVLVLVMVAVGLLVLNREEVMEEEVEARVEVGVVESRIPQGACPSFCQARYRQRIDHHGGDWTKSGEMLKLAKAARERMVDRLKVMYSEEYYKKIFLDDQGNPRTFFMGPSAEKSSKKENPNDNVSIKRFQRKLAMKVLQTQIEIADENRNLEGCNCTGIEATRRERKGRRLEGATPGSRHIVLPELKETYRNFVWATGGHSAAASHGNLRDESYTDYMERLASDVFASVGLNLIGRNYAKGGMNTAPEVALCLETHMGIDADIIAWDSGMTEAGSGEWRFPFYANRVGQHRNRPVLAGVNLGDSIGEENMRTRSMRILQDGGMSTIFLPFTTLSAMIDGYPDMAEVSPTNAKSIGEYAAYFKCKTMVEQGDPQCGDLKYNETICPIRFGKASWHPGWRSHANIGHGLAIGLVDNLIGALEDLSFAEEDKMTGDTYKPEVLLKMLQKEDDADRHRFRESAKDVPAFHDMFTRAGEELINSINEVKDIKGWMPYRAHSYCHSAHLPSEGRYLGLFEERGVEPGMEADQGIDRTKFDKGISFDDLKEMVNKREGGPVDNEPLTLTYDANERKEAMGKDNDNNECGQEVIYDFKDWMTATSKDGWKNLVIPNPAEQHYYEPIEEETQLGLVMVCFMMCPWNNCWDGEVNLKSIDQLEMEVNGERVSGYIELESYCGFLKNQDGGSFFKADDKGQYSFRIKVKGQEDKLSYVRITSVAVL